MTEPSLPEEPIFAQALEISSPAERAAFLDRACGQNPALRAEVEDLPCGAARRAPPERPPGTAKCETPRTTSPSSTEGG
jgi:hypothetical protein